MFILQFLTFQVNYEIKKDRMIVFKGQQNLCDVRKTGELGKVFLSFLGIPITKCPVGNLTRCDGDKDKFQLTTVRKIVSFFTGSFITFEARAKHNSVNFNF